MIKKLIATMALLVIVLMQTAAGNFYLMSTNTDYVDTKVGPIPIEYTISGVVYSDDFYKDFTK